MKYEDLKELKPGDQIIIKDPAFQKDMPYVFISESGDGVYHFIAGYAASFMIKDQDTIDGFNARKIDKDHELWDEILSNHGESVGGMLIEVEKAINDGKEDDFFKGLIDKLWKWNFVMTVKHIVFQGTMYV